MMTQCVWLFITTVMYWGIEAIQKPSMIGQYKFMSGVVKMDQLVTYYEFLH